MSTVINDTGFVTSGVAVAWADVLAITTYKRDLFTYDDICLAFKVGPGRWVEVSEEEPGFAELVKAMEKAFPGVPRNWSETVVQPPFATNHRVLWTKVTGSHGVD